MVKRHHHALHSTLINIADTDVNNLESFCFTPLIRKELDTGLFLLDSDTFYLSIYVSIYFCNI